MDNSNDLCFINEKEFSLSEIEKMGYDSFNISCHIFPRINLFKYYSNKKEYNIEEKKYRNYSIEALKNNTIYLQDTKNFDDCFDCAVDLEWDKFLFERLRAYCEYFKVDVKSINVNDMAYSLSLKLCELGTMEMCIEAVSSIQDEILRASIEIFIKEIFVRLLSNQELISAIFNVIQHEYEKFNQVLSKFRIACFSTSPYLNRMWSSAYADNNRGFCIEYEIDVSTDWGMTLHNNTHPVIYSAKRGDLFLLSKNDDKTPSKEDIWQMYFNGLLRKDIIWKDQQEWRLILFGKLIQQNPIPFYKIKKVYLGNRMPLKERKKIATYCRKNNIEYVGLKRQPSSYKLVECQGDCYVCAKCKIIKPIQ